MLIMLTMTIPISGQAGQRCLAGGWPNNYLPPCCPEGEHWSYERPHHPTLGHGYWECVPVHMPAHDQEGEIVPSR
jgi:hypothetical protein